jgi:maleate cis-trans isomerase
MLISPIIQRLRENLPSNYKVGGVAEYEAAADDSRLALPSFFVIYAGSTATPVTSQTYEQTIDERLQVIAVISNTADRTGKTAQEQVHTIRANLFALLLNYQADPDANPLEFVNDRMWRMDAARYFHIFEFRQIGRLAPEDGAQLVLDNFDSAYIDWNLVESQEENHPDAQDRIENLNPPE